MESVITRFEHEQRFALNHYQLLSLQLIVTTCRESSNFRAIIIIHCCPFIVCIK